MNFFRKLAAFVYGVILIIIGAGLMAMALGVISPGRVAEAFDLEIYEPVTVGYLAVAVGVLLVVIGVTRPHKVGKRIKKDRVITFQNPDGEVSVSLSAVEDYIRKISRTIPGIKDIKPHVEATKKGIEVVIAVTLAAGSNIPEISEMIQMEVKNRVRNMIGVEEAVSTTLHVTRIEGSASGEPASGPVPVEEESEPNIPFREME